ncbi:MAG TPA: NUDIX domain-containing protein [Ignavibacteria bacterium]
MIENKIKNKKYANIEDIDLLTHAYCVQKKWGMAVFIAVFDADLNNVLLVRLGEYATDSEGGHPWNLPGGGVEYNELPSVAILRELLEETSFDVPLDLQVAGLFKRPNYYSKRHRTTGELIVLFCAVNKSSNFKIYPGQPEIIECGFYRFDFDKWLKLPAKGKGILIPSPLPRHWVYWTKISHNKLKNVELLPVVYEYKTTLSTPLDSIIYLDSN